VAWGSNSNDQCDVPSLPPGLTYVRIAAGGYHEKGWFFGHTLALRSDGSVVAWGNNIDGQCNVPLLPPRPRGPIDQRAIRRARRFDRSRLLPR